MANNQKRKSFSKEPPSLDTWGTLGNLSESQTAALQEFLSLVSDADIAMSKFHVESKENAALRFLRARNFDVHKASILLSECVHKKTELQASKYAALTPDECANCNVEAMKNWYPHAMKGFDKFNRPILFERNGLTNPTAIHQMATKEGLINYHWWTMENALNRQFASAQSRASDAPISTCVILDFNGLGMQHCTSKMMEHVKTLVNIDNCCYPELLGKMLVINAPWLAVTTWEVVRRWLDPRTQAKIEILAPGAESNLRLLEFVDAAQLPLSYGGTSSEEWTSPVPHADFLTINRGSSVKHSIDVPANRRLTIESYTFEGEMSLEIYSSPLGDPSSAPAAPLSGSPKLARRNSHSSSHHDQLVPHASGTALLTSELVKASGSAHRRVFHYSTPEGEGRCFTAVWTNTAKLVSRQLTFVMTISGGEPETSTSATSDAVTKPSGSSCVSDSLESLSLAATESTTDTSSSSSSSSSDPSTASSTTSGQQQPLEAASEVAAVEA